MISVPAFRKIALSLPGAIEGPHFENAAFLIKGKIFATLNEGANRAVFKLLPEQQEIMTTAEPAIFERVPNYWGNKGWTWMHLKKADKKTVESAMRAAWANVTAPKPLKSHKKSAPKRGA